MTNHNTLITEAVCPHCLEKATLKIQFQYGEVWDYIYQIGDELRWGSEDDEIPEHKLVVIDGVSEDCEICDETSDYVIFAENNILKSVSQNYGEYLFLGAEGFLVLED